jgi:hypothetical protein
MPSVRTLGFHAGCPIGHDLCAFPKPRKPDKSIIIFNVHPSMAVNPMGEPADDDPHYDRLTEFPYLGLPHNTNCKEDPCP